MLLALKKKLLILETHALTWLLAPSYIRARERRLRDLAFLGTLETSKGHQSTEPILMRPLELSHICLNSIHGCFLIVKATFMLCAVIALVATA